MEILGRMGRFVSKQSKVGLLINSPWEHPGSYVRPEITLAVIQMCRDAGAKEIGVFEGESQKPASCELLFLWGRALPRFTPPFSTPASA
jgi:hypothetical protein